MSRNHKPRKAYRPRAIAINTLALALHGAAKPAKADRNEVLAMLRQAAKALREGVATERQWSIVSGSVELGNAIERQGIVRGLAGYMASAEDALQTIYNRAMATRAWRPTSLWFHELDAIQAFIEMHAFQVNQLSRAEFKAAIEAAQRQVHQAGHTATVVRGNLQGMAV